MRRVEAGKGRDMHLVDGDGFAVKGRGCERPRALELERVLFGSDALLAIGVRRCVDEEVVRGPDPGDRDAAGLVVLVSAVARSEERRVGTEWTPRMGPARGRQSSGSSCERSNA